MQLASLVKILRKYNLLEQIQMYQAYYPLEKLYQQD